MKVTIDKESCIGCGLCESSCPDVFEMKENIAVAKSASVPQGKDASARQMAQDCPVNAIAVEE